MRDDYIYSSREFIEQIHTTQEVANIVNDPAVQDAIRVVNSPAIQSAYQIADIVESNIDLIDIQSEFSRLIEKASNCFKALMSDNFSNQYGLMVHYIHEMAHQIMPLYSIDTANIVAGIGENYSLIHYHPDNISDEEVAENEKVNNKIVTEIFKPEEISDKKDSGIITISPINDVVLKYLSQNPQELYQLTSRKFEEVMAEIYNRLGYEVELTKATRDGGKDIIIRKPDILGDFIYYVECKRYSANNPVGIGIVRDLAGIINMDRVNGGIIATTSYFAKDAKDLILNHNLNFQIKLHDYKMIQNLLSRVV